MRSIAEIDRDHEGMGKACVRHDHGCTYPYCTCDRTKRIVPNVRGVGDPKLKQGRSVGVPQSQAPSEPTMPDPDVGKCPQCEKGTMMADGEVRGDARELRQMLADCEKYLKDGETPAQRIERERRDTEAVLNLLIREKHKTERMGEALRQIAGMDPDGKRADDLGRASRIARGALAAGALASEGGQQP